MADHHNEDEAHVQAKFWTKLKDLSIPETPFSLPINSGRLELNSVLLGLLLNSESKSSQVKFDFLINNEFLRTNLKDFIEEKQLATESVIEIECTLKEEEFQLAQKCPENDWVSSLDLGFDDMILSGCYDNTVALWDLYGNCIGIIEGHLMPVKCVSWCSHEDNKATFLSASHDQTILLWEMKRGKVPKCVHVCKGHAGSVDCLSVQYNGQKFASGSFDNMIKIWDSTIGEINEITNEDDSDEGKRQKLDNKTDSSNGEPHTKTPLITFSGHKEGVSALFWHGDSELLSASMDHSICKWNVNTGVNVRTIYTNKAILDLTFSPHNSLVATGSVDKFVRLYDMRLEDGEIMRNSLSSHNGWVSTICWSPSNENQLISGSYDCSVNLWDTRKTDRPFSALEKHSDKVMALSWKKQNIILSGGADCQIHVNKQLPELPATVEE